MPRRKRDKDALEFGGRRVPLPRNRIVRLAMGGGLVCLGLLGFLPVLGFWMVPLGLMVLAVDVPAVDRMMRRFTAWWRRRVIPWWRRRRGR